TAAVRAARDEGIGEISIDLIFALPEALGRDWRRDLDAAVELSPEHVSLYGLTIESRTPLGRWRDRGAVTESPEERYEEEFLAAHERLSAAGFEHYEVSNYALPGHRARHNSSYWRRVPYLGLGPSAHSFDGSRRSWNVAAYEEWVRRLAQGEDPREGHEDLAPGEIRAEEVYLGLRTREGLPSGPFPDVVSRWTGAGWAEVEAGRLRLTPSGWLRLDALAADLTVSGSRYYI
ncbi:MAG: coproporphyrinogen-III oxidase family protein, partial [Gemmatimonadaceae bacterium]